MQLTSFTTYNDIRAILGLTAEELPDADLELETYLFDLERGLSEVGDNLLTDYEASLTAYTANTSTAQQSALYKATRLYSAIHVSLKIAYSLPMRAEKSVTDGKAAVFRFSDTPVEQMIEGLRGLAATASTNLKSKYASFLGATSVNTLPSFMAVVSPSTDPVTG